MKPIPKHNNNDLPSWADTFVTILVIAIFFLAAAAFAILTIAYLFKQIL